MKSIYLVLVILIAGCAISDKKEMAVRGTYKRLSEVLNNGMKDSVILATQNKIYTADHLIFAGITSDSSDYFGFGEYSIDSGKVKETILYVSVDSVVNNTAATYVLEITQSDKGFKQVIRNITTPNGLLTLTEEYETAGNQKPFWLDGAWLGVRIQSIKNTDTTTLVMTQYKVYESGNFMYGHSYADSTEINVTGIGYGTFEVLNDSTIKETVTLSTYKNQVGSSFVIGIKWIDDSHYRQTVNHEGVLYLEEYERIVKKKL